MHVHEPSRDLGLSTEASGPPRRPLTKLATMIAVLEAAGLGLFAVTVPDTRRGKEGNGPPGRVSAASGPFTRVWQVLVSNQRRLSRRFTDRYSPSHHIAYDLRKCCRITFAAPTLSAICPWMLAPGRRIARTATDTVRRTRLTCQDTQGRPPRIGEEDAFHRHPPTSQRPATDARPAPTSPGIRRSDSGSSGMAGASEARSKAECDPGNHKRWIPARPRRRDGRVGGAAS
jgi:hypothetical protein